MTTQLERILSRVKNVRQSGSGWTAQCPVHDDKRSSLSISLGDDGKILLHCFVGCPTKEMLKKIGLKWSDLFQKAPGDATSGNRDLNTARVTLVQYAEAKKLPMDFLRSLGLSDIHYQGRPAIRIPYFNQEGTEISVRFRTALEISEETDNRFRWRKGSKPTLYGLWRKTDTQYCVLCEGESDCHTLWHHGLPALGIPGASIWKEERDAAHLDGLSRILVVIEPDNGGVAVQAWLAQSKIRDRAYLLELDGFKDPSALHVDDPEKFLVRFNEAMDRAVPFAETFALQQNAEKAKAWNRCRPLAELPNILDRFAAEFRAQGVVGEERNAKILYLALITRFLDRPVSVAVKGPSSGGKSFITEQVLRFFPQEAVYCLTAMSERALAYTEADLRNRFLVIFEAAGLSSEFTSYLIRSLLSEGRLVYEVVEKTSEGMKPRRIEKDGPTGLLVTTTAPELHPENETRLLSIHVADTREQTKAVLLAMAAGPKEDNKDLDPWKGLQAWLQHAEHRVSMPFAQRLAELTLPVSVRLRRDFAAVLALIRGHAMLHQASRRCDDSGRIIATLEDYAAVRALVADIVSEGVDATVSPAVRETVTAVSELCDEGAGAPASLGQLTARLRLDKSAVSRRVTVARKLGFLINLETRKGRPAQLALGAPLPEELEVFPTVEALQCCSAETGVSSAPSPLRHGDAKDAGALRSHSHQGLDSAPTVIQNDQFIETEI